STNVIDTDRVEKAERIAREEGKAFHNILMSDAYLGKKNLLAQLSDFTKHILWEDLSLVSVSDKFRNAIPRQTAEDKKMIGFCSPAHLTLFGPKGEPEKPVPAAECSGEIYLAVCEPLSPEHLKNIESISSALGKKPIPVLTTAEQIQTLIEQTYSITG
ncbi:MAG: hypothetical protein ABIH42_04725, partial [Planctomycetota bacterium]